MSKPKLIYNGVFVMSKKAMIYLWKEWAKEETKKMKRINNNKKTGKMWGTR